MLATASTDVVIACVGALQVVLLALIAAYVQLGTREQKKLNGHAAELLAARLEHATRPENIGPNAERYLR